MAASSDGKSSRNSGEKPENFSNPELSSESESEEINEKSVFKRVSTNRDIRPSVIVNPGLSIFVFF